MTEDNKPDPQPPSPASGNPTSGSGSQPNPAPESPRPEVQIEHLFNVIERSAKPAETKHAAGVDALMNRIDLGETRGGQFLNGESPPKSKDK